MTAAAPCEGFAWVGQSMLCCDECGWPWFLHAGDRQYTGIFAGDVPRIVPFSPERQEQIGPLIAAWEANAIWQRERSSGRHSEIERRVGKDFPYPTGPSRPYVESP